MNNLARRFLIYVLTIQWSGLAFSQHIPASLVDKIDPRFRMLMQTALEKQGTGSASTKQPADLYGAILRVRDQSELRSSGVHLNAAFADVVTVRTSLAELIRLASFPSVRYVEFPAEDYPTLDLSVPETGVSLLHAGFLNQTPYRGKGVIVAVFDSGIDWKHLDFRDPADTTKSRIIAVWDQTLTPQAGEAPPSGFSYGVEYTRTHIEDELDGTPTNYVRTRDTNGHGTHVAGTAAGNGNSFFNKYTGVAPEADILFVKGGDGSFSRDNQINGLAYIQAKASALGKPVVLNMSIGGHSGPHDGTISTESAVNSFVGGGTTPGRVVAISAGNDGASPIHTGGTLTTSASTTLTLTVPTYTATAGSDNDRFQLDVWLDGSQTVTATVTSPNGITFTRQADQSGSNIAPNTADGTIELYNFTSGGLRNVQLYVRDAGGTPIPAVGDWKLTLSNVTSTVSYDAWLVLRTVGANVVSLANGNTQKTVAMPGTAQSAITVGSYVTKWGWASADGNSYIYSSSFDGTSNISSFSSIGPTRDGRQKPEIAAPGQGIIAALSTASVQSPTRVVPSGKHFVTQGTSMASPHIAGMVALLLEAQPSLNANSIKSLLTSTARVDAFTGAVPNMTWGYGKVDALKAVATVLSTTASVNSATMSYDGTGTSVIVSPFLTGSTKYAVRFTPTISGQLTALQLNLTTAGNAPIAGTGPLVCEVYTNVSGSVGGIPGTKIGSSVLHPFERLTPGTNNSISMVGAGVMVNAGTDYHLVISVQNSSDVIKVRADDGTSGTNRSSIFNGTSWANFADPASGQSISRNLRMRGVVTSVSGLVSVPDGDEIPSSFSLSQNYPNPFNPMTTIRYTVPDQGIVRLRVFDIMGREMVTLVNQEHAPGTYRVVWDGRTHRSEQAASGVYFYRIETAGYHQVRKMALVR